MKKRVKRHAVTQPPHASYRFIPLTQNQNAIVDASDFEWLMRWNWQAAWAANTQSFYAQRCGDNYGNPIAMHSFILECKDGEQGDHINHNTLDNRRRNLRKATYAQNIVSKGMQRNNTSGYRGVSWHKTNKKWTACIGYEKRLRHLGTFSSKEEAARAYDAAALKYYGRFAVPNLS